MENDFVEGIHFSKKTAVIMAGKFKDFIPIPEQFNDAGRWYKPWFFKHVESFLTLKKDNNIEYIPTRDYYHRHSRSIFWEMRVSILY